MVIAKSRGCDWMASSSGGGREILLLPDQCSGSFLKNFFSCITMNISQKPNINTSGLRDTANFAIPFLCQFFDSKTSCPQRLNTLNSRLVAFSALLG